MHQMGNPSLGREDCLEKEMATQPTIFAWEMAIHRSILAWESAWTEESGGLQSMCLKKSQTGPSV